MEKYEISGGISPTGPDHDPDQDNERNDQEKDANKSIENILYTNLK